MDSRATVGAAALSPFPGCLLSVGRKRKNKWHLTDYFGCYFHVSARCESRIIGREKNLSLSVRDWFRGDVQQTSRQAAHQNPP